MSELALEGVDTSFVLNKNIDIANAPSSVRTILMSALFQYNFKYCRNTMVGGLKPLMAVRFSDGTKKTYYGEDVNTALSTNWGNGNVYSTMSDVVFEYADIDANNLLQNIAEGNGSIMFDARIKEDSNLDSLLHSLVSIKSDKWLKMKSAFRGKSVSIDYSDRYLITPLGCMLLAHLIKSIKEYLEVTVKSIHIAVIKPTNDSIYDTRRTNIDSNFQTSSSRNKFLEDAVYELVGTRPTVADNGYIDHERCFTVKTYSEELCIRPDAGIANGWKPFGRDYIGCSDEDFRDEWGMYMKLYNQKKNHSGILYTVSYNKY